MKKTFAMILIVLSLCLTAIPTLAAEIVSTGGATVQNVYAKQGNSGDPNVYTANLSDGGYSITTTEGFCFTVTPSIPDDALTLVIRLVPITEKDAYEWFSECTKDYGEKILPFDLYFVDKDGNRAEMSGSIDITVSLPDGFSSPKVLYLSQNGDVTSLSFTLRDGKVLFSTDHNSYFVITAKSDTSPQTGDSGFLALCIALLFVSGCVLAIAEVRCQRVRSQKI